MKYFHKEGHKHWIIKYGFEECSKTVIGLPCQYETSMPTNSGLYYIWIGIDFNKQLAHIYIEYDCGGELFRTSIDLSYIDTEDESELMTELDKLIDTYMEWR